eukprot:2456790-Pleurochrysis_carterae.AAC.10
MEKQVTCPNYALPLSILPAKNVLRETEGYMKLTHPTLLRQRNFLLDDYAACERSSRRNAPVQQGCARQRP